MDNERTKGSMLRGIGIEIGVAFICDGKKIKGRPAMGKAFQWESTFLKILAPRGRSSVKLVIPL